MGAGGVGPATGGEMGTPDEDRRLLGELNELAAGYCAAGRFEDAMPLFRRVVAGCMVSLGADDPDTLISHGNLVLTELVLDPRGPALDGLDANVAARHRVLGARHPATRSARNVQLAARERAVNSEPTRAGRRAVSAPRGPRGARFPRRFSELGDPVAPHTEPMVIPTPRGRPRGARFPRLPPPDRSTVSE